MLNNRNCLSEFVHARIVLAYVSDFDLILVLTIFNEGFYLTSMSSICGSSMVNSRLILFLKPTSTKQ